MAIQYGTASWVAVRATADGPDAGAFPDLTPVAGYVLFRPSAPVQYDPGSGFTVFLEPVRAGLDAAGVMRDGAGNPTVTLVATNSDGLSHQNWTWEASFQLQDGPEVGPFPFLLPAGTTVDLTGAAPVVITSGVAIIRGPKGDKGDQGLQGIQGVPGDVTGVPVESVNGQTGVVLLDHTHVGAAPAGDYVTASDLSASLADRPSTGTLAAVAFSGSYTDLIGSPPPTDPEVVRDVMAAALVAGPNITITTSDAGDTTTIAASGEISTTPADGSVTNVKVAAAAAISADKLADGTTNKILTATERTKLAGVATGATAYTDEMARDALAAALVAGSGITITPNDAGDTITVAATGAAGAGGSVAKTRHGIKGWTTDPVLASATQVFDVGRYWFSLVEVAPGDVLTDFITYIASTGTGVTLFKGGMHALDGTLLRSTANLSGSIAAGAELVSPWQASGVNSGYTVPAGVTAVYIGALNGPDGTAGPTLPRMQSAGSALIGNLHMGAGVWRSGTLTGLTDMPASLAAAVKSNVNLLLATA